MGKKICQICLVFLLLINSSSAYTDVSNKHWGYELIKNLTERNILSGYPDGSFKPEDNMTIAEFLSVLIKLIASNKDVSSNSDYWADRIIEIAKEKDILLEQDYSEFDPESEITRWEICQMLFRSIKGEEIIENIKLENTPNFADIDKYNSNEYNITKLLRYFGVINGYPDNTVRLGEKATRAEVCAFIENYMKSELKMLSGVNDKVLYDNDIAKVKKVDLPSELKKWRYSEDIPYVTTTIKEIDIFEFNKPIDKYKELFNEINQSNEPYFEYRRKFGENNYVIAVSFNTSNNMYDKDIYSGYEFLRLSFPEEEINIIDAFDTDEIKRQINGNANIGEIVRPHQTRNTSAFYVVDKAPEEEIRLDRDVLDIDNLPSFHSLKVELKGW